MTTKFEPGDRVIYVPHHAEGNTRHPDCEQGIVSSVGKLSNTVFVRFYNRIGTLKFTPQGCDPDTLVKETL